MRSRILLGLVVLVGGCRSTMEEFYRPGPLLAKEIRQRVGQIGYLHGIELYSNLVRLAEIGEPAIPFLLEALADPSYHVRASAIYVLGLIQDRRTIPDIRKKIEDPHHLVRLEAAASLLGMGAIDAVPHLIRGLADPDRKVRYKCFEALHKFTGLSFDYDFRAEEGERAGSIARWEQWWEKREETARPREPAR